MPSLRDITNLPPKASREKGSGKSDPKESFVSSFSQSLKWSLSDTSTESPMDKQMKDLSQEYKNMDDGWLLNQLFPGAENSIQEHIIFLLLRALRSGNAYCAMLKGLGKAWGCSDRTASTRTNKTADELLSTSSNILDLFKKALLFKVRKPQKGKLNELLIYVDSNNGEDETGAINNGWLSKDLFRDDKLKPSDWSDERWLVALLFRALCSGNPSSNFNESLARAFGMSRTTFVKYTDEFLHRLLCPPRDPKLATEEIANSTIPFRLELCPAEKSVMGVVSPLSIGSLFQIPACFDRSNPLVSIVTPPACAAPVPSFFPPSFAVTSTFTMESGVLSQLQSVSPASTVTPTSSSQPSVDEHSKLVIEVEKDGIVEIVRKDSLGRKNGRTRYMKLTRSNKPVSKLSKGALQEKAKKAQTFMNEIGEDEDSTLFKELARQKGYDVQSKDALQYTIPEAYALMKIAGTTVRLMNKIDSFGRTTKGFHQYPAQFGKRLSAYENLHGLVISTEKLHLVIRKGKGKGEPDVTQLVSFSHLEKPHRAVSLLIQSAMRSGRFMDSSSFSRHDDKCLVMTFGCDLGGSNTSMLGRLVNRKDGNSSEYCCIFASVEKAGENHENLRKTIYKKGSAHRNLVQNLVQDKLHAIVVTGSNLAGQVETCECAVVQMVEGPRAELCKTLENVEVSLNRGDDLEFSVGDLDLLGEEPKQLGLEQQSKIQLEIQLMTSESKWNYIGFILLDGEKRIFSCRFENPIAVLQNITVDCYQLLGFPSHDTKHAWLITGISCTHSVSYPCLVCTLPRAHYEKHGPAWMDKWILKKTAFLEALPDDRKDDKDVKELQILLAKMECLEFDEDEPSRRTGEYSIAECYDDYNTETLQETCIPSGNERTALNQRVKSVTHEPLLYVPPNKDPLAPMHSPHGIMESFGSNVRDEIKGADRKALWIVKVKEVHKDATETASMDLTVDFERHKGLSLQRRTKRKALKKEIEKNHPVGFRVDRLKTAIKQLDDIITAFLVESKLTEKSRLKNGAKELVHKIEYYLSSKSKLPKGQGEYTITRAFPIVGKVEYRKEFGGRTLSHNDWIVVLEQWSTVCEVVGACYEDLQELKLELKEIMDTSAELGAPLLELAKVLKSQDIIDDDRLETIKYAMVKVYVSFRVAYPNQKVFPKLHHILWDAIHFIEEHKMFGILAEQGFEALHKNMNKINKDLKPMVDTNARQQTTFNRIQAGLNPEFDAIKWAYLNRRSERYTNRSKTYKTSRKSRKDDMVAIAITLDELLVDERYFEVDNSTHLIKENWKEVYQMVVQFKVPASWSKVFDDRDDLGNVKKEEARYCDA
jgi:hypothetical protein